MANNCKSVCRLCDKIRISQSVEFTGGNLVINLPAGSYGDGCKYCIIIAQTIPSTTTITAPVYLSIGTGAELYPLVKCDCSQVSACGLRTRTRYSTVVSTNPTGGSFKLLGKTCCAPNNDLLAIDGTAPTTTPAVASAARSGGKSTTT